MYPLHGRGFCTTIFNKIFFNNHRQLPYAFNAGMVLILIFVLNYIFMKEDWLKTIKEVRSQEPRQVVPTSKVPFPESLIVVIE